jgi:hypothetical protein
MACLAPKGPNAAPSTAPRQFTNPKDGSSLVYVKGGKVTLGSDQGEADETAPWSSRENTMDPMIQARLEPRTAATPSHTQATSMTAA